MDHKDECTQTTQAKHNSNLTHQVLHAVEVGVGGENGECSLEEIVQKCDTYPEEEVLAEIDRLNRRGGLRIIYKQQGLYAISLPKAG